MFYTEIKDNFWQNVRDDSGCMLGVKNFLEITLSRSASERNAFLCFMQNFKITNKNMVRKQVLEISGR